MKSTQVSGGVSGKRHILLFLCLLVSTEHQPTADCDFVPLAFWLLGHPFLSDEWFPQLVALMTPPEDTFIDRKSFKSLLASHLRFLSPEMKVCILFKCKIEFQDMSPLAHPGLQNHYRTAVNSHIKKFWKELKSFPRLSTVLCRFEKKNILRVWDILYFGAKGRGFLLCAARF